MNGIHGALSAGSGYACNCLGPRNGEPCCPCAMRNVRIVDGRYVRTQDLGPVPSPYISGYFSDRANAGDKPLRPTQRGLPPVPADAVMEMETGFLAQGIEAQRAETGTGSVHESPVLEEDAPTPYPTPTNQQEDI